VADNAGRKLFFGLFIFPLLIAVGMALLLCAVVFLTHEDQTPDTLIAAIKTGAPGKRWQKAYELSNELNRQKDGLRESAAMKEIISILTDTGRYDAKTRGYMALALSHFSAEESVRALIGALNDADEQVRLYSLWSLGTLRAASATTAVYPFLTSERSELRKMAAYVLGVLGDAGTVPRLAPLLSDPVEDVRWNAALSLARLKDASGQPILMQMLERDALARRYGMSDAEIEQVMINATKGLALIRSQESIKILRTVAESDKSLKVRQAAMNALEYSNSQGF